MLRMANQSLLNYEVHCWFPLSGTPNVPVIPSTWGTPPCTSSVNVPTSCVLNEFSLGSATNGHIASMSQFGNFNRFITSK